MWFIPIIIGALKIADYMVQQEQITKGTMIISASDAVSKYYQGLTAQQLQKSGVSQATIDSIKKKQHSTALLSTVAVSGAVLIGTMVFLSK
jgi:hypothetical protein